MDGTPFDAKPHRAKRRKWDPDKVKKHNPAAGGYQGGADGVTRPGHHGVTRVRAESVPTG